MNVYAIFVILVSVASPALALDSCTSQRLCYCETKTTFLDLNKIGNTTFDTTDQQGGTKYAIRLCQTLTLPFAACRSVHGCQYNPLSYLNYTIANSSDPIFNDSKTLIYRSANRTTIVNLVCSTKPDNFTFTSENPKLTYNFVLTGKSVCPSDLPVSSTTTNPASSTTTHASNTTTPHTTSNTTTPHTTSNTTTPRTTSNTTTHANTTVTTQPPTNSTTVTTSPKSSPTTTAKASNTTTSSTKSSTSKTSATTYISSTTTTHKGAATTISSLTLWTITSAVWLSFTLF